MSKFVDIHGHVLAVDEIEAFDSRKHSSGQYYILYVRMKSGDEWLIRDTKDKDGSYAEKLRKTLVSVLGHITGEEVIDANPDKWPPKSVQSLPGDGDNFSNIDVGDDDE